MGRTRSVTIQVPAASDRRRRTSHCESERDGESGSVPPGGPQCADAGLGPLAGHPRGRACSRPLLFWSFTSWPFSTFSPVGSKYAPGAIRKSRFSLVWRETRPRGGPSCLFSALCAEPPGILLCGSAPPIKGNPVIEIRAEARVVGSLRGALPQRRV